MKCISVAQPWAWAILAGLEHTAYRCGPTDYRGDVLIHASAKAGPWEREQLAQFGPRAPRWDDLPRGLVVGVVELWACSQGGQGEWVWGLRNPRFVKPFRIKPGKGLFDVARRRLHVMRPGEA